MSGEFRWIGGGAYFHNVLDYHLDDPGSQELSRLLYALYKAAQPLEHACAWVEACDSSPPELTVAAVRHGNEMIRACENLVAYIQAQQDLAARLIRSAQTVTAEQS
ncbi:MAG: hypothetical protein M0Z85_03720 [Gammaproteobacteria bacterium]|nr:hypothetical protein [Gammaproteobacteria bacterium]